MCCDDVVCPVALAGDMPPLQGRIHLHHGLRERRQLGPFLCGDTEAQWCDLVALEPKLNLYWRYTTEQEAEAKKWECQTVWLHSRAYRNGEVYNADVYIDLEDCVNQIGQGKFADPADRYSLLVSQQGMSYDITRYGGDLHLTAASGRRFTFSVRRDPSNANCKVLLAIAWT